jgi:hypothetical protein
MVFLVESVNSGRGGKLLSGIVPSMAAVNAWPKLHAARIRASGGLAESQPLQQAGGCDLAKDGHRPLHFRE